MFALVLTHTVCVCCTAFACILVFVITRTSISMHEERVCTCTFPPVRAVFFSVHESAQANGGLVPVEAQQMLQAPASRRAGSDAQLLLSRLVDRRLNCAESLSRVHVSEMWKQCGGGPWERERSHTDTRPNLQLQMKKHRGEFFHESHGSLHVSDISFMDV